MKKEHMKMNNGNSTQTMGNIGGIIEDDEQWVGHRE